MGIFKSLFSKKNENQKTASEKAESQPEEILSSEQIEQLVKEMTERTKKQCLLVKINAEKTPGIFDSKAGGYPYWDFSKEYPVDEKGNKMVLLAQFNLSDNKHPLLPQTGMLQFFVSEDSEFYGMDFDERTNQKNFRVIYHETIDSSVTVEKVKELGIKDGIGCEGSPVYKEAAFDLIPSTESILCGDYNFYNLITELGQELFGIEGLEDEDSVTYKVMDKMGNANSSILGTPDFTQDDPRNCMTEEEISFYDTCLFKLDSSENQKYLMWGDMGVACFLMNSDDLSHKKFTKIYYTWDCC